MKINKISKLQSGIYAHICPICGIIHASASEPEYLPEFSICNCDCNGNKQPVYELFEQDGKQMIRRNKFPRFIGETFGQLSEIENIEYIDNCTDPMEISRAIQKAYEYIKHSKK